MDSPSLTKAVNGGASIGSNIYGLGDQIQHQHHSNQGPALRNQNSASLSSSKPKINGSVSGAGGTHYS